MEIAATFLALKMLLRMGGTASAILAVALLVAIPASMESIVNHINYQAEALGGMVDASEVYLILERDVNSIMDSKVEPKLTNLLNETGNVAYVSPQRVLSGTLSVKSADYAVTMRAVENVQFFLNIRHGYVKGDVAGTDEPEVNVGVVLARFASLNLDEEAILTFSGESVKVRVAGIFETSTESDAELIVPMVIVNRIIGDAGNISFIEFSLKHGSLESEVTSRIEALLPPDVRVVKVQQLKAFIQSVNRQTLSFLALWSSAVFIVIAATLYVVATRLITEAEYELAMLRALGGERRMLFTLVSAYTVTVALFGAILGLSIGVAGSQVISTAAGWIKPTMEIAPFLQVDQALIILTSTVTSSIIGCLYPAFKTAKMGQKL